LPATDGVGANPEHDVGSGEQRELVHPSASRVSPDRPQTDPVRAASRCRREQGQTMSYKSREKKRNYKKAEAAIGNVRSKHGEAMKSRHYLTIVTRACSCNRCGHPLRDGAECVYRHTPREILCVTCAELEQIRHRPSIRWERRRRGSRSWPNPDAESKREHECTPSAPTSEWPLPAPVRRGDR